MIIIRFRLESHYRLKDYYEYSFEQSHSTLMRSLYEAILNWKNDNASRPYADNSMYTFQIDYIALNGLILLKDDVLRINAQTFRRFKYPILSEGVL